MENNPPVTIYDQNSYYGPQGASRLWPSLNLLLNFFDWLRAKQVTAKLGFIGNALDVGAGSGTFLYFLRRLGWKVSGTTASVASQKIAQSKFGVDLFFKEELPDGAYDLITYWHVFEHLKNPQDHAKRWPILMTERGVLMIEVPNIHSLGALLKYNSWLGSDPAYHINHQTFDQIASLLNENNIKIFKREGFSLKFSYVFLWSSLLGVLFGQAYSFDFLMQLLRNLKKSFHLSFFRTFNALVSLIYLFPFVISLIFFGVVTGRGEVVRIYARKHK